MKHEESDSDHGSEVVVV